MKKLIILLRGVNVGGHAKLQMEPLREALLAVGFANVLSHGASGNLIVDTSLETGDAKAAVNNILNSQFGISGDRTIVREAQNFGRIVKNNPFRETAQFRPERLHVHFLNALPLDSAELNLTSYKGPERLRLAGEHLYVDYVQGAGNTALSGRFLEVALGTPSTARNWSTVLSLVELAQ